MAEAIAESDDDQIAAIRAVHVALEEEVVRRALQAAEWSINGLARALKCPLGTARAALARHPDLAKMAKERGPGRP